MFGDIFQKNLNFQGFYIVYIIIWQVLGWKKFTPSKLGETGLQKIQNGEYICGTVSRQYSFHSSSLLTWSVPTK